MFQKSVFGFMQTKKKLFFDQGFDLLTLAGEICFAPVAFFDLVVLLSHLKPHLIIWFV